MNAQILLIKGVISELPAEDQEKVHACHAELTKAVDAYGDLGIIALALFGSERSAQ